MSRGQLVLVSVAVVCAIVAFFGAKSLMPSGEVAVWRPDRAGVGGPAVSTPPDAVTAALTEERSYRPLLARLEFISGSDGAALRSGWTDDLAGRVSEQVSHDGGGRVPSSEAVSQLARSVAELCGAMVAGDAGRYVAAVAPAGSTPVSPDSAAWRVAQQQLDYAAGGKAEAVDRRAHGATLARLANVHFSGNSPRVSGVAVGDGGVRVVTRDVREYEFGAFRDVYKLEELDGTDQFAYWFRGGNRAVDLANPPATPDSMIDKNGSALIAYVAAILARGEDEEPIGWASEWVFDPAEQAWYLYYGSFSVVAGGPGVFVH
ncbi:MAG: hypothetical protein AAGB51_03510 [Planctomycetota bacterium]